MTRQTLAGPVRHLLEVKKSRFLAQAKAIEGADQALAWLRDVANPDATHNCWAYRSGQAYRFCDDGEPGGTAGRPILSAIDSQGLDGVIVVVSRWYGGINLGAGGLVRAYGGSAAECLRAAARREIIDTVDATVRCDFRFAGALHALLDGFGGEKLAETFAADGLRLHLRLPAPSFVEFANRVRDLSRGSADLQRLEIPTQ
jgi:uncharacterized YigZ family protein